MTLREELRDMDRKLCMYALSPFASRGTDREKEIEKRRNEIKAIFDKIEKIKRGRK